jgi:hypothetical protein
MSYSTIATIEQSATLLGRVTAAVATETDPAEGNNRFGPQWTGDRSWDIAATPGWAEKWESAVAGGITDPGANPGVITDADILARVQPLLAIYPMPEAPT